MENASFFQTSRTSLKFVKKCGAADNIRILNLLRRISQNIDLYLVIFGLLPHFSYFE